MATSGSFSSSFGTNSGYKIILEWKRNSADVSNNKSNVTVTAYLQSSGSSYTINSSATKNGSMTINGTTYSFTFSASLSGSQKKQIYTKTVDIYHNSDGTKSFSMSVTAGIAITFSSGYVASVSTSGTGTLDSIPRTSSFTLSTTNATLGSTAVTVTISRASTSFTHKVWVVFGSNSSTVTSSAGTSASWTPPLSLASQIPNSTTGIATVYVQTLNGSTAIGTTSKTMTYTVPSSVVPTITSLTATLVASSGETSYIQGLSRCKLVINGASGSYGSTISSYKISGGGFSSSYSTFTTSALKTSGTITFTGTVTDSRGRTSASKTVSITVEAYSNPVIANFNAVRCDSSGTKTEDGTYAKVYAQFTYSSVKGNTASAKVEYSLDGTSWTSGGTVSSGNSIVIGGGSLNANYTYQIKLTVTDKFKSSSAIRILSPSFATMSILAGGKGVSFGKMATKENYLDVYMNTYFDGEYNVMNQGYTVHTCSGTSGSTGYVKFATITITNAYSNSPIQFYISQRGGIMGKLTLVFNNSSTAAGHTVLSFLSEGSIGAYIVSLGSGSFDLYIYKREGYDHISINDVKMNRYMRNAVTIVWTDVHASTLPSGYKQADYTVNYATDGAYFGGNLISIWGALGMGSTIGTSDAPWGYVYTEGVVNASDEKLKENIKQINNNKDKNKNKDNTSTEPVEPENPESPEETIELEEDITMEEMREFIRDEYDMYSYNFKNHPHKEYGFIAQHIADSKVGSKMLINTTNGYLYSQGSYVSIIAGALKNEIEVRDAEIASLQETILALEERLLKLEQSQNNEQGVEE